MGSVLSAIALIVVAYWFFRSPLCCALTDAVRERHGRGEIEPGIEQRLHEVAADLRDQMAVVRAELYEIGERLDFAERALTAMRDRDPVGEPRAAAGRLSR